MLKRKIFNKIKEWSELPTKTALLIDGARQVGKTTSVRDYCKSNYKVFIEINLLDDYKKKQIFKNIKGIDDLLLRISLYSKTILIEKETVIFFDEIQIYTEADLITISKFLLEQGKYDFIFSGCLLGISLNNIKSWPVGYLTILNMYPLDFEEFLWALGYNDFIIEHLYHSYKNLEPLDESIHKTFLDIFKKYLIVGGMPEAVNTYINTNSMVSIQNVQNSIYQLYIKDSSQYAKEKTLYIEKIYKYMSSVMSSTKKRIVLNDIKENMRGTDASDDFIWLEKSGLAIPVYKTNSIEIPLVHYTNNYYLKLYYNDVGILSSILFKDIQNEILDDKISVNLGSIYENYVAQELRCNIDDLFYYDNRKYGEIDFIFQKLPDVTIIEVKSGKDYYVHSALNNLLKNKTYNISKAIVLSNNNISVKDGIKYLPIYMTMFLTNDKFTKNIIL